jgi:hypothetical protein
VNVGAFSVPFRADACNDRLRKLLRQLDSHPGTRGLSITLSYSRNPNILQLTSSSSLTQAQSQLLAYPQA